VAQVVVVKTLADVVRPPLKLRDIDFDGGAAQATGKVMVVRLNDATSIEALTPIGHNDVDFTVLDQLLQLRIDRRERYSPAVSFDQRMEFLSAHEALELTQDAHDLSSLHRISGRGHDFIVVVAGLLSRTVLINVVGIILERVQRCRTSTVAVV
jgi:hypothetical protein